MVCTQAGQRRKEKNKDKRLEGGEEGEDMRKSRPQTVSSK